MKNKKARLQAAESMRDHYKEMQDTAIGELHFENTQIQHLLDTLDQIEDVGDPVINAIIRNAREKHQINKMAHVRKVFPISYR